MHLNIGPCAEHVQNSIGNVFRFYLLEVTSFPIQLSAHTQYVHRKRASHFSIHSSGTYALKTVNFDWITTAPDSTPPFSDSPSL